MFEEAKFGDSIVGANLYHEPIGNTVLQLRLRNLIQVIGYNIESDPGNMLYFTLHGTSMSPPFYTSNKLIKNVQLKKHHKMDDESTVQEINIHDDERCVLLWEELTIDNFISKIGLHCASKCVCIRIWERINEHTIEKDREILFWGLYFSGLVPIAEICPKKIKTNAIIFKMYDKYFTSPDYILDTQTKSKNVSEQRENNRGCDKNGTIEYSPNGKHQEKSVDKEFPKNCLKISYDIKKLLSLQIKQRNRKNLLDKCKELSEKICMKSASCLNIDLFSSKTLLYRYQNFQHRGMGKQLSKFLFQEKIPLSPEIVLKCQELRRSIENENYRCRILTQEKERLRINMKLSQAKVNAVSDYNIEIESWLMSRLRYLSRDKEHVSHQQMMYNNEKEIYNNIVSLLTKRQHYLLRGLSEIYKINKVHSDDCYCINGISLPNAESYQTADNLSVLAMALGYVCHTVLMCSTILNIPLRNQIKHEGSKSKVVDNIKVLPASDTEFPLYCRSSQISNSLLYAVFLLNQNISQIKYISGLSRGDLRATLKNLYDIMKAEKLNTNIINSIDGNCEKPQINRHQSPDINIDSNTILPTYILTTGKNACPPPRISRSMDDYDGNINALNSQNPNKSKSEPILYST